MRFLHAMVGPTYEFWQRRRVATWLLAVWSLVLFLVAFVGPNVPVVSDITRHTRLFIQVTTPLMLGTLLGLEVVSGQTQALNSRVVCGRRP